MNLKGLKEKRNSLVEDLTKLQELAEVEVRALSDEETSKFDELETEIRNIDLTIEKLNKEFTKSEVKTMENKEKRSAVELVNDYIRTGAVADEMRANMGVTQASVTIPQEIGNDIIKDVKETCDVLSDVKNVVFNGTYKQIKRKTSNAVNWTDEFGAIAPTNAEYESVDLGSYKCSALSILSHEIINQSQFDIVNEIRQNIAEEYSSKIENAIFHGTGVKQPTGILTGLSLVAETLDAEMLIDMLHGLKAKYFPNAVWYMSRKTLSEVRKLKTTGGDYLFTADSYGGSQAFQGLILGKPVKVSEHLLDGEILFGDLKQAYCVKMDNTLGVQVLNERYQDIGAIGVVSNLFMDGKVIDDNGFVAKKVTIASTFSAMSTRAKK